MLYVIGLAIPAIILLFFVGGSLREAFRLAKQPDIDEYIRNNYKQEGGPLNINNPSPFALWLSKRIQRSK